MIRLLIWIALSAMVGWYGTKTTMGFLKSFFISFFASPVLGLIIVMASSKKQGTTDTTTLK